LVGRHGFLLITCFAKQLYPVLPVDQPIHLLNCLVARKIKRFLKIRVYPPNLQNPRSIFTPIKNYE